MPVFVRPDLPKKRHSGWIDLFVLIAIVGLFYLLVHLGREMGAPLNEALGPSLSLEPIYLPYYAARSLLRMIIALVLSFIFTVVYGYIAAYVPGADKILIPLLDVLQSVPVLGFLSVSLTGFMALFPGSMLGVELASIFAIFTSQVWNMTFSFYYSLRSIPRDLREASAVYGLNWWRRLTGVELPFAAIPLVWNTMMSFGGGWFFLAASEAISVLGQDIRLPGLGSYLATAIGEGNMPALFYALFTMAVLIVLVDQVFWRPLVAWSQRFKLEETAGGDRPTSWLLEILRRSLVLNWLGEHVLRPLEEGLERLLAPPRAGVYRSKRVPSYRWAKWIVPGAAGLLFLFLLPYARTGLALIASLGPAELLHVVVLGFYTLLRTSAAVLLGALWTVPVGVAIGLNPRLNQIAQPLTQIAASFPANMLFPFFGLLYLRYGLSFELGAIPLMMLGTQWYILFNVIAGASALPSDLKEAAVILKLSRWDTWRVLILPGILRALVTGGVTAAGGAWNASIVAEVLDLKGRELIASGLGAYITQATRAGNWGQIIWGILVMSLFVVTVNRLFWRRLYRLAEEKYSF
ncbi:MAG: NitT/TauT family transport system permease protein [Bacillota bacterium]|jgi:NitT/TauT family transport system permease protein|nr:NitT/TauT family transport system permease protein [Bacillota bacterium]MDK2854820.1 NitT/TauT family transport system permease protein [Bacillota bacterium]